MRIEAVMSTNVQLASPDMPLKTAAMMMRDGNFGLLPVGENDRLVGTITDATSRFERWPRARTPSAATVAEAQSEGIHYCFEDQTVEEAAEMMSASQIRRLPVLNRDKWMVGIGALGDLALEGPTAPAAEALSGVSEH